MAEALIKRVEGGEEVITSVIHLSEVLNIMEARLGLDKALRFLEDTLASDNIKILEVARREYEEALVISARYKVSPNDAIAAMLASRLAVSEVYSLDKHFDNIPKIKRYED